MFTLESYAAVARAMPFDVSPIYDPASALRIETLYREIPFAECNYNMYAGWVECLWPDGVSPTEPISAEAGAAAVLYFLKAVCSYDGAELGAADYMLAGLATLKNPALVSELIALVCFNADIL